MCDNKKVKDSLILKLSLEQNPDLIELCYVSNMITKEKRVLEQAVYEHDQIERFFSQLSNSSEYEILTIPICILPGKKQYTRYVFQAGAWVYWKTDVVIGVLDLIAELNDAMTRGFTPFIQIVKKDDLEELNSSTPLSLSSHPIDLAHPYYDLLTDVHLLNKEIFIFSARKPLPGTVNMIAQNYYNKEGEWLALDNKPNDNMLPLTVSLQFDLL